MAWVCEDCPKANTVQEQFKIQQMLLTCQEDSTTKMDQGRHTHKPPCFEGLDGGVLGLMMMMAAGPISSPCPVSSNLGLQLFHAGPELMGRKGAGRWRLVPCRATQLLPGTPRGHTGRPVGAPCPAPVPGSHAELCLCSGVLAALTLLTLLKRAAVLLLLKQPLIAKAR